MNSKIKIFVADDHPIFRKGLIEVIRQEKKFEVIGETGDGRCALEMVTSRKPEIAILDINMPGMNGFEIQRALREAGLNTKVIFLTMHKEEEFFSKAMDIGIWGYVVKESASEDMLECISSVVQGRHYISPGLSEYLIKRSLKNSLQAQKSPIDKLTDSEKTILKLISEHKTSQEIADMLFISVRTVENHRMNICKKLEIHGINALIKYAIENKGQLCPS